VRTILCAAVMMAAAPALDAQLGAQQPGCPADPVRGYPLSVLALDSGTLDTLFLRDLARTAAFRWQTPSPGRRRHTGWRQVRHRTLPPEPRWADDWTPDSTHRAVLAVTLHREGREPAVAARGESGDRLFYRSLQSVFDDPMPGAPPLPAFPSGTTGDSVRLELHFGAIPPSGEYRTVRFAAQQRPVRLLPGTLRVTQPPGAGGRRPPSAIVKYDVGTDGRMVAGSFQVLEASDRAFGRSVGDALAQARFTPAESNCRPIAHTVLQAFGS